MEEYLIYIEQLWKKELENMLKGLNEKEKEVATQKSLQVFHQIKKII